MKQVMEAAKEAIDKEMNQYARPAGFVPLVQAISKVFFFFFSEKTPIIIIIPSSVLISYHFLFHQMYSPLFDREIDPLTNVITTNGSSEGLYASVMGLVDAGDEVVFSMNFLFQIFLFSFFSFSFFLSNFIFTLPLTLLFLQVVIFEPFFDIYNGAIAMAQGVPKYVPLRAPVLFSFPFRSLLFSPHPDFFFFGTEKYHKSK